MLLDLPQQAISVEDVEKQQTDKSSLGRYLEFSSSAGLGPWLQSVLSWQKPSPPKQEGLVEDVYMLNILLPVDSNKPVSWSVSEKTRERKVFEGGELFEGQILSDAQGHSSVSYCLMTSSQQETTHVMMALLFFS